MQSEVREAGAGGRRRGVGDYVAALQCGRRLWLAERTRSGGDPLAAALEARGSLPGALEALRPDAAVLSAELDPGDAARRTSALLADPGLQALRGGVFERQGWSGRADLVERRPDGLALRLLVADTAVRELDLDRAALLAFLVEGTGLRVVDVQLWLLDRDARAPADRGSSGAERGVGWQRWLRTRDVTGDVRLLLGDVPAALATAAQLLARQEEPDTEPSPHCMRPLRCEFWERCTAALPRGALVHLPRLRPEQFHALRERGIARIADIPDAEPLEPLQRRTREAWRADGIALSPGLADALRALEPAAVYLDFETAVPRLPLLPDSAPLEPVPVQWSALRAMSDGPARASEFLAEPGIDPREPFARALLAALVDWPGPIAVYSEFESQVLERLAQQLPALAPALLRVREQLVDLLALMREHVAHPDFLGSYSLKRVAPALCPEIRYGDLVGVANGADAARVLESWIVGTPGSDPARARVRAALLAYCRRDVEALLALHAALRRFATPKE